MDNGIYIALSRQMGLVRDLETTANNIANINTPGYNAEDLLFRSYLVKDGTATGKMAFTQDVGSYRDTSAGTMKETGGALDMAIAGRGYFTVETPLGNRYTRAGNFQLDGNGTLVTAEGYPVLDDAGQRVVMEEDDREVRVGEAGNIYIDGEERAVLGIVQFDNEQMMEQVGETLYKSDIPGRPVDTNVRVLHGMIEGSNVQPVVEMTRMITITRAAAQTAKYIETMYELQRKASNIYAKVNG